ncbi:MAG: thioredoxin family protein [Bacteroidales bacterium]|nr:thioredoxin family protein [Candidatus Colimorpha onthohippi]
MARFVRLVFVALLACLVLPMSAQPVNPVEWKYRVQRSSSNEAMLFFEATLQQGWHIYSTKTDTGGPLPTEFHFNNDKAFDILGAILEAKPHEAYDELFKCTVRSFQGKVLFRQKIRCNTEAAFQVRGTMSYQLCNDGSCIPPDDMPFSFSVPAFEDQQDSAVLVRLSTAIADDSTAQSSLQGVSDTIDKKDDSTTGTNESQSLWKAFLIALLGGLITMLTPCVFPMVPMTVNFFIHGGRRRQAWFFGGSIVFIFTVLGALLTLCFGSESLYFLGTHWIPNMIFFVVFLVFSLSFFGLFELHLPSRWATRSDAQADKGGFFAPFFMALTTVLVSFSCTGPILGAALVGLATSITNAWVSLVTMLGFGVGFALPFTVLALFPTVLKNLKSGSWLSTVKVTFAFLELAFGLKFLSMADLYCGWHLLDREVYLALWIVIFALLGCYLLGWLHLKKTPMTKEVGVVRLFVAILTFAFVVYMLPGLWGAPLKAISGFIPPMETQDFKISMSASSQAAPISSPQESSAKYADQLSLPDGFSGFFDLQEAQAEARRTGKPIFIDFTGKTCANCREMEHYVWADSAVANLLKTRFVICALYVDENSIQLPQSEWVVDNKGRTIKTLGRRNLYIQTTQYNMNAQPYYVVTDADGKSLTQSNYKYDRNPVHMRDWLLEALNNSAVPTAQ